MENIKISSFLVLKTGQTLDTSSVEGQVSEIIRVSEQKYKHVWTSTLDSSFFRQLILSNPESGGEQFDSNELLKIAVMALSSTDDEIQKGT